MSPAQSAIAVLIDLAQKGEIDPWDVQVIDIIDRFLSEIQVDEPTANPADLPRSGQTFLWASMLVLLKADTLDRLQQETATVEDYLELADLETVQQGGKLPNRLETLIRRRTSAPPTRKRRVTLQELITQIEQIALEIGDIPVKPPTKRPPKHGSKEAIKIITELAHDENLTELASLLEQFFREEYNGEEEEVELDRLLQQWHHSPYRQQGKSHENHSDQWDRVGVFWALLLLSSQSKVVLKQEEFYQDLTIKPLTHPQISQLSLLKSSEIG